jgi:hypothetical protein
MARGAAKNNCDAETDPENPHISFDGNAKRLFNSPSIVSDDLSVSLAFFLGVAFRRLDIRTLVRLYRLLISTALARVFSRHNHTLFVGHLSLRLLVGNR